MLLLVHLRARAISGHAWVVLCLRRQMAVVVELVRHLVLMRPRRRNHHVRLLPRCRLALALRNVKLLVLHHVRGDGHRRRRVGRNDAVLRSHVRRRHIGRYTRSPRTWHELLLGVRLSRVLCDNTGQRHLARDLPRNLPRHRNGAWLHVALGCARHGAPS